MRYIKLKIDSLKTRILKKRYISKSRISPIDAAGFYSAGRNMTAAVSIEG